MSDWQPIETAPKGVIVFLAGGYVEFDSSHPDVKNNVSGKFAGVFSGDCQRRPIYMVVVGGSWREYHLPRWWQHLPQAK